MVQAKVPTRADCAWTWTCIDAARREELDRVTSLLEWLWGELGVFMILFVLGMWEMSPPPSPHIRVL